MIAFDGSFILNIREGRLKYKIDKFALPIDRNIVKDMHELTEEVEFRILDDDYKVVPLPLYVLSGSFITDKIDNFIHLCHQHGLVHYFKNKAFPTNIKKPIEGGPQVLNMEKLSAGFVIWIGSVVVACLVFLGEHVVFIFHQMYIDWK